MADWVSCGTRLPETEGRYLCTVQIGRGEPFVRDVEFNGFRWCNAGMLTVLAWTELPEVWRENG